MFPYSWGIQINNILYFSPDNCTGINYPIYCGSNNATRPFYSYNINSNELIELSRIQYNGKGCAKCKIKQNGRYYILAIGGNENSNFKDVVYVCRYVFLIYHILSLKCVSNI